MIGNYFLGADKKIKFEIRDMTFDDIEPDEVLIKNMACGICGTDIHIYHGEKGSAKVDPPVVLGHEFSGIIVKVGSNVKNVKENDHVTVDPNMYCNICRSCRMGRKQNCENLFALGVNVDGGFAQYCKCKNTQVYKINDDISFDVAAMAEPLACVIHGIDKVGISLGQNVLVIGGGTIGLLMVQMAKLRGASTIILSEPIEMRRKIGKEIGASYTIDPINEDLAQKIDEYTKSEGIDVVIECVGKEFAVAQAIQSAGLGGKVLLFSVPSPEAKVNLSLFDVYKKELTIVGSMINPDTHQRAVNIINNKKIEIEKLITHTYGLKQLEEGINMQMKDESIKVIVHPQD